MAPLGLRNNNPLNIRFSPKSNWVGQTGSNKGFCVFDTLEHGFRAALKLLNNYIRQGYDTIPKIIARWAPESENNTKAYIDTVIAHVASDLRSRLGSVDDACFRYLRITEAVEVTSLCYGMMKVELGYSFLNDGDKHRIDQAFNNAKSHFNFCK